MDRNEFLPELSQNLLETLEDDEYYDITIEVGNNPYVKIFRAHMVILNCRSSYLRRILSTNKKKNDETLVHIKLPNILPEIFQIILRYIYGGRISLEEYDTSDIIKILVAASELNLQKLIVYLQSFLIENKANWMEQNFNLMYQTCFMNDSFLELQKFYIDLISEKPEKIFESDDFISIPEKSLISLIQNDNLQMNEIQVWKHVLKWGLAQNPELSSDPTSLSKDDFNILKNTLQQCIPFIRFYNLTSREFLDSVFPYKEILPEELYTDLLKCFLDSDNKPSNKSKPRKSQHVELISKCIDRLEITNDDTETIESLTELEKREKVIEPVKEDKIKSTSLEGSQQPLATKSNEFATGLGSFGLGKSLSFGTAASTPSASEGIPNAFNIGDSVPAFAKPPSIVNTFSQAQPQRTFGQSRQLPQVNAFAQPVFGESGFPTFGQTGFRAPTPPVNTTGGFARFASSTPTFGGSAVGFGKTPTSTSNKPLNIPSDPVWQARK